MIEKFKAMDTKQKVLIIGGGIMVLFFLIKAISGGGSGTRTTTAVASTDPNDVAQALNESFSSQIDALNQQTIKSIDAIMGQIELNDKLQSDALSKTIETLSKNQEMTAAEFANALNGIANMPQPDYDAIFANKFGGLTAQLEGLTQTNAALTSQLNSLKTSTPAVANNPNPTSSSNYQASSTYTNVYNPSSTLNQQQLNQAKDAVLSGSYNAQTTSYISNLTGSASQSSMQQAANTVQSNQAALQAARDAYKGTSTSTPGVAQASVAKVEVVGKK